MLHLGKVERARNIARHERQGTLRDFAGCAFAHATGPVSAIVPVARGEELRALIIGELGAVVTRERQVIPRLGEPAGHLLIEGCSEGGPVERMEPLVVHIGEGRQYSAEVRDLLRE